MKAFTTAIVTTGFFWLLTILAVIWGYVLNAVALFQHLPVADFETLLRVIGLVLVPIGALFGFFM